MTCFRPPIIKIQLIASTIITLIIINKIIIKQHSTDENLKYLIRIYKDTTETPCKQQKIVLKHYKKSLLRLTNIDRHVWSFELQ